MPLTLTSQILYKAVWISATDYLHIALKIKWLQVVWNQWEKARGLCSLIHNSDASFLSLFERRKENLRSCHFIFWYTLLWTLFPSPESFLEDALLSTGRWVLTFKFSTSRRLSSYSGTSHWCFFNFGNLFAYIFIKMGRRYYFNSAKNYSNIAAVYFWCASLQVARTYLLKKSHQRFWNECFPQRKWRKVLVIS